MTQPRDVQDYEAQARELYETADLLTKNKAVDAIAAALRAEGKAALERAAQVADEEHAEAWKSSRAADARGDHRVGAADAISAATAQRITFVIRALIAPAPESPPAQDPIHEAYLAADEYGQPPVAPAPDLRDLLKQAADMLRSRASTDEDRAYVACFDTALASPDPRDQRIAELEAALAKAHDAIRWACGEEPLKDGRWFDCRAFGHEDSAAPRYWWRSILRLYSGLPDAPAPSKEPPP